MKNCSDICLSVRKLMNVLKSCLNVNEEVFTQFWKWNVKLLELWTMFWNILIKFFYQGRGEACDPSSKLRRCQGSLFCDKTTNLCTSPELNTRCTKEAINRELVQNNSMVIYVKGDEKGIPVYFQIPYASDMDMVVCDSKDGNYELKQCRGSK